MSAVLLDDGLSMVTGEEFKKRRELWIELKGLADVKARHQFQASGRLVSWCLVRM